MPCRIPGIDITKKKAISTYVFVETLMLKVTRASKTAARPSHTFSEMRVGCFRAEKTLAITIFPIAKQQNPIHAGNILHAHMCISVRSGSMSLFHPRVE